MASVNPDGSVKGVEVAGGTIFADAAKTALLPWRFAVGNAESVAAVTLNFDSPGNEPLQAKLLKS